MRIDLTDSSLFEANQFWDVLTYLRRNDPVYWHRDEHGGFWVLTRYDDIVSVYADQNSFSSRHGMNLGANPDAVAAVAQRMLIVSDPPSHTRIKRVLMQCFMPDELARIELLVRGVVKEVLRDAVSAAELDFLDVAKKIPNSVVCSMMGIPRSEWEWIGQVTTDAFEGSSEEVRAGAHGEIFLYFSELLAQRRRRPGVDFVSRIACAPQAEGPAQGPLLSDEEVIFNCNGVLAGANETTRYSAAGGLLALVENPEQWRRLKNGGAETVQTAVEEVLRWTVPGVHAMRTATRSTAVGGVAIRAGDRVTLWNVSANRDEAVFEDPDAFRVDRSPNRHITFGAGRHLCLGARLARLELGIFLEELVAQVAEVQLAGEPAYNASNFTWGLQSLPVRLVPTRPPNHLEGS
jgi:cytochrome P450